MELDNYYNISIIIYISLYMYMCVICASFHNYIILYYIYISTVPKPPNRTPADLVAEYIKNCRLCEGKNLTMSCMTAAGCGLDGKLCLLKTHEKPTNRTKDQTPTHDLDQQVVLGNGKSLDLLDLGNTQTRSNKDGQKPDKSTDAKKELQVLNICFHNLSLHLSPDRGIYKL